MHHIHALLRGRGGVADRLAERRRVAGAGRLDRPMSGQPHLRSWQVCPAGPGLKELLTKNSDYIVNVSKGFFADYPYRENWNKLSFSLSSGDTIEHEFFEKKWYEFDPDGEFYCSNHPKDFLFINHDARPKDIQEGQVAIVEYREFENGKVSLEIPCEDKNKIAGSLGEHNMFFFLFSLPAPI